jgi:hypothetical protein
MTLDDAKAAIKINRERAPYLSYWRHAKSGKKCVVKFHVLIEATLEPAVVYYERYADPVETWCRPAAEFFDGRFERIDETDVQ